MMPAPMTATVERAVTLAALMNSPDCTLKLRTDSYSGVTPTICVLALLPW